MPLETPIFLIVPRPPTSNTSTSPPCKVVACNLSLTKIVVESVERIVLPIISIVPNNEVPLVLVILAAVIFPLVSKLSPPRLITVESVDVRVLPESWRPPAFNVGTVKEVVIVTAAGKPIVKVFVPDTTDSISFEVPNS